MNYYEDYLKQIKKKKLAVLSIQLATIICFFVIWELLAKYNLINVFLFSKPSDILNIFLTYFHHNNPYYYNAHIIAFLTPSFLIYSFFVRI